MSLKWLIYTSRAAPDLDDEGLERIHASACTLNALDGVTGLLVFNGTEFLQIVEGAPDAIDDLRERLLADPRHADIAIRGEGRAEERSFPDWDMALVRVSRGRFEARRDVADALPPAVPADARVLLVEMTELISS